jgi:hypothetical protein
MNASDLTLDIATHVYSIGTRIFPSVTQALSVIESYDHVPFEILERARIFGRHVHQAVDLFNCDDLDEDSLDPPIERRLRQYKRFLRDTKFEVTHSEQMVCSGSLGYAGTLDIRGRLGGIPTLIDCKSGAVPRSVGPQTAAYREACTGEKPRRRIALQLRDDDYKIYECRDPSDFSNFLSALNVYRFQRRNPSHAYQESRRSERPAA